MNTAVRIALVLCAAAMLAGCLLGRPGDPVSTFSPQVRIEPRADWPHVDWSLNVQRPAADQLRDSPRLLVRRDGSRLQAFPGAVWTDSTPELLQTVLIRGFEDSARLAGGVGRPGETRARATLLTDIRHFEAVDRGRGFLTVELEITTRLVRTRDSRVLASHTFVVEHPAADKTLEALVAAFEAALGELAGQVIGWTLEAGEDVQAERDEYRDHDR